MKAKEKSRENKTFNGSTNRSTFFITNPHYGKPEVQPVLKKDFIVDGSEDKIKKLKILIAEDDESSAMLQTEIVKSQCRDFLYAVTGIEAVEACRNNPDIDLILMDIQMPEMNGYEATRLIRQFNKDIVIIVQTANVGAFHREKAIEAGCNDYITKPYNQAMMIGLIKKYSNKLL